ncbi:hypothetical protein, partial [Amycolatopsis anabasis]|uniref:hypothetical protein n=1 Tax=Amycolatopsis anabasis TaxID=1840409 RepID=UPI001C54FF83
MGLLDRIRRRRVPAPPPEPADAPPVPDGGWRAAGSLRPVVRRVATVSDPLGFRDGLAAWQNPSFRGEMGHAVSRTAPTGVVSGLVRPRTLGPGAAPPVVHRVPAEPPPRV